MPPNQKSLDGLMQTVIDEIVRLQKQSPEEHKAWLGQFTIIPPAIPLGDGRQVLTSASGLAALREFGTEWRSRDERWKRAIDDERAAQLAVRAFGEILGGADLAAYSEATPLMTVLADRLQYRLAAIGAPVAHYAPCQIFDAAENDDFTVGPVRFMRRKPWLDFVAARAKTRPGWLRAVSECWDGTADPPEKPSGTAGQGADGWTAYSVIDAFGPATWIGVVEVVGMEPLRARECAEIAIRIALETLSLPLDPKSSRLIRGPEEDIRPRLAKAFSQARGRDLTYSSALDLPRLRGTAADASRLLAASAEVRRFAGKALTLFVDATATSQTSKLCHRWLDAVYWFGKARRERIRFIALVNAGVSLDVLAKGKKARGIVDLCCTLFGMQETDQATSSGLTLRQLVETIYNDGRSQIGHGGRPALLRDLPIEPETALNLAAEVIAAYIARLYDYRGADEYEAFLKAIPGLKAAVPRRPRRLRARRAVRSRIRLPRPPRRRAKRRSGGTRPQFGLGGAPSRQRRLRRSRLGGGKRKTRPKPSGKA